MLDDGSCKKCRRNTFSGAGATFCVKCPHGKVSDPGSTSIDDCDYCKNLIMRIDVV